MAILTQFLFRLALGLALAMAWTPSSMVTAGFFRVHLYVLLGIHVVTTLIAASRPDMAMWPPLVAAVASYLGSAVWLYEWPRAGKFCLYLVALASFLGAVLAWPSGAEKLTETLRPLVWADTLTSGLIMGLTTAAMLLGHWYLNTPTMELAPLQRLLGFMFFALVCRAAFCGWGLVERVHEAAVEIAYGGPWYFYALRWLFGLLGTFTLTGMAWATLKVPNTQSATGILYVAVIAVFLGELTSLLLSLGAPYPV